LEGAVTLKAISKKWLVSAFCLFMVSILLGSVLAEGKQKNRFLLRLTPSQNAIQPGVASWKLGTAVFVIVTMINDSDRVVHYGLTNPGWDYEMDVRDASGNPVPETERLRELRENLKNGRIITGRNILGTLRPHETAQDTIEVSSFYDLSSPGEYSIQVQREFLDVGKGFVKSTRLVLTVTP
jgi:hypothetical protein